MVNVLLEPLCLQSQLIGSLVDVSNAFPRQQPTPLNELPDPASIVSLLMFKEDQFVVYELVVA